MQEPGQKVSPIFGEPQKEWVRARKPEQSDRSYPPQQRRIYRRKIPIPCHLASIHISFSPPITPTIHSMYSVSSHLVAIRTQHHAHSSIPCYLPHINLLFPYPSTCPLTTRPPCHHQRSSLPATPTRSLRPLPSSTSSALHPPPYDQP